MVRAKKSLGQHFLKDPVIVNEIIDALNPQPGQTVVEIGPGEGVLTLPLVNSGAEVIAVELDRRLAPKLAAALANKPNFHILESDILQFNPEEHNLDRFMLIGNLPYNITTPIIDWLLRYHDRILTAVLMMQKEVAQRIGAPPGRRARTTISVLTALFYDGEVICNVPPASFSPPPKVNSAVVRFSQHDRVYPVTDMVRFEKFVRHCFAEKRKSLLNNLNSAYPIPREELAGIIADLYDLPTIRAEQLTVEQFIELYDIICDRV